MPNKLEKFENIIKLLQDGVNKEEFIKAFQNVLDILKKFEQNLIVKNDKSLEELKRLIDELAQKLENLNNQKLGIAQKQLEEYGITINKLLKDQEVGLNFIRDKVRKIKEGKDGLSGKNGLDGINGKDGSPDSPEEIRDKLEFLKDENRLDKSAIKGLEEEFEKLRQLKTQRLGGGGGFSRVAMEQYFVDDDTPVEVPNGVITDFSPTYNILSTSLKVYNDGQRMKLGATKDYTYDSTTKKVVYNTAPLADVIITFDYRRA